MIIKETREKLLREIKEINDADPEEVGFKHQKIESREFALEYYDAGWNECLDAVINELKLMRGRIEKVKKEE
jgi:predicted nucleotidyltransferase